MDINNLFSLNGCGTGARLDSAFVTSQLNHISTLASTEWNENNAWNINPASGQLNNNNNKYNSYRVLAVAALDEEIKIGWIQAKDECCANKMSTQPCEDWRMIENWDLWDLLYEIYFNEYKPSTSTCFVVTFPTLREIFAAAFRDRIVQHWICIRINPLFEEKFKRQGDVSFNCRKGYGCLVASKALYNDMATMSDGWKKRDVWIGRSDIQAFFMHIDRFILWDLLEPFIKENYKGNDLDILLRLTKQQIFHHPQDDCIRKSPGYLWEALPVHKSLFKIERNFGMAIGNILSQLCANFYLSFFDEIMIRLCNRYDCKYKRFVDDYTVTGPKWAILKIRPIASRWLKLYLHLDQHPDKFYLQPVHHGCKFVGSYLMPFRTYLANRTFGGLCTQIRILATHCRRIEESVTLHRLNRLRREVSSLNSYVGFAVHHYSFKMRQKLFSPYLETIRKVCILNSDMLYVKVKNKYNYQYNLIKYEDESYGLDLFNR